MNHERLLISLYIDNELDLDEKIEFVEAVHNDVSLKDEAVDLLTQEKRLRSDMVTMMPAATQMVKNVRWKPHFPAIPAPAADRFRPRAVGAGGSSPSAFELRTRSADRTTLCHLPAERRQYGHIGEFYGLDSTAHGKNRDKRLLVDFSAVEAWGAPLQLQLEDGLQHCRPDCLSQRRR